MPQLPKFPGIELLTSEEIVNPSTWIMVSQELGEELIKQGRAKRITVEKTLLPSQEEIEILVEEATKLCNRLNAMCVQLMKAEPDKRTALHVIASYLQVNVVELKAYLNGQGS